MDILTCMTCGWTKSVAMAQRLYQLVDGHLLWVHADVGWCDDCATAVEMESLPDPGHLDADVARWQARPAEPPDGNLPADLLGGLVAARARREWRMRRRSAPRCLECGATTVRRLPIPAAPGELPDAPHPSCGGTLRVAFALVTPLPATSL